MHAAEGKREGAPGGSVKNKRRKINSAHPETKQGNKYRKMLVFEEHELNSMQLYLVICTQGTVDI